jgi:hypothetical protein
MSLSADRTTRAAIGVGRHDRASARSARPCPGRRAQQVGVPAQELGGSNQRRHHRPAGRALHLGEDAGPDGHAQERGVVVHRVTARAKPERTAGRRGLRARDVEERTRHAAADRAHPGERFEPAPSDQRQQDRLGLIVGGVPDHRDARSHVTPDLRHRRVPDGSSPRFDRGAALG